MFFDFWKDVVTGEPVDSSTTGAPPGDAQGHGYDRPYGYQEVFHDADGNATGATLGFGGAEGRYQAKDGTDVDVSVGANLTSGAWLDDDGDVNRGVRADAQLLKLGAPDIETGTIDGEMTGHLGLEGSLLDASLDAYYDEGGTLGIGAQANVASAAISGGTTGSETDEHARIGLSYGAGAAGRVHFGDADRDGNREYGFGFDAGPISMDLKTEDPLRTALQAGSLGLWDGDQGNADRRNLSDALTDTLSGVEDTQGQRGGVKSFGEMNEVELTMAALFNPGLNDDKRREVLARRRDDAARFLFGGMYDAE